MWCWYFRRRMDWMLGGVLSRRSQAALRRHLGKCPDCAEVWEEHLRTRSLVRSWKSPEPSPVVRRRVMAAIQADPFSREYRHFGSIWWRRVVVECTVGVALILFALHLIMAGPETKVVRHHNPVPPPGNVALPENYVVELMNDPRTAHLSDGERFMLLGALVSPAAELGKGGGDPGSDNTPCVGTLSP